jgi:uncharacterized OB-fold protein
MYWRLQKQRYNMTGSKCKNCGNVFFPQRPFCSNCRRRGEIETIQLTGRGEIESFTIIRTAPEGFETQTPYAVGLIKLDEGTSISGQIVGDIDNIEIGKKVKPVFRKMYEDGKEGLINYGVKFELDD